MKRKIFIQTIIMIFVFSLKTNAQLTTGEKPISFDLKNKINIENINIEELSAMKLVTPDLQKVAEEDKLMEEIHGISNRFAYPVRINFNINNSGHWKTLDDGSKLWTLDLVLPEALSTNVIYDKFWLPKGAKFFVYNKNTQSYIGAVTSEFIKGTYENPESYSTGLLLGENVTFEYYQPATVKETPIIEIGRIDYGYRFINYIVDAVKPSKKGNSFQENLGFGSAANCHVNINCSPEGDYWQKEKNAVARIMLVYSGGSTWCSGALMNNTREDFTPYFLTAFHCLKNEFDARSIKNKSNYLQHCIFYWHYEHPSCNNNGYEPRIYSTRGARVIANSDSTGIGEGDNYRYSSDFALFKLEEDPRDINGANPYYLGWSMSSDAGTNDGVGIHHPRGDVKKISTYGAKPVTAYPTGVPSSHPRYNMRASLWEIRWIQTSNNHGIDEGGSSGSPLINKNGHVIGQLLGSPDSAYCENPSKRAWYGKLNVSWNNPNGLNGAVSDSARRLNVWLDPINRGVTTLNGKEYRNCALLPTSFRDIIISTSTKVEGNNLYMKNVKVNQGNKLTVNSCNEVIIDVDFEISTGAEFEINIIHK